MPNHQLAIVIPAFKADYFRDALESIAAQTDRRFRVYVGDDASPADLGAVAAEFSNRIDLVYHRFSENLGQRDLVGHWMRCLDLTEGEEWVWLFSDDDIMEPACVAAFYRQLAHDDATDLYHFDPVIIDGKGDLVRVPPGFPASLSATEFFYRKINYRLASFAVEYVFRQQALRAMGGFVPFDLAWCSDDATWMTFACRQPIRTVQGARIHWRASPINITSQRNNRGLVERKVAMQFRFLRWARRQLQDRGATDRTTAFQRFRWAVGVLFHSAAFGVAEKARLATRLAAGVDERPNIGTVCGYLLWCELKALLRKWLNKR